MQYLAEIDNILTIRMSDNGMILEIKDLEYAYDSSGNALNGLDLCCRYNEKTGIIGCNGAGKSTLLKLIVGLLSPSKGSVKVDKIPVERANLAKVRKTVGFVFQDADSQLFMPTVAEDVAFGPANYGVSGNELEQLVQNTLKSLGIEQLAGRRTTRLSGGEKKLVSIATVLALKPKLLILDEPAIALDPGNRRRLINILRGLDMAQLIASHDLDMVWDVCDRVVLIKEGVIIADGKTKEILSDKSLLEKSGLELPLRLQGDM